MVVALDGHPCLSVAVDFHLLPLHPVERADVIQSPHMVAVGMGNQNAVQVGHMRPQHLLSKVWSYVYEDVLSAIGLYQGRCAQMFIMLVF
jgi:hypothetical protein